jgi:uncharacterized protein with PIN domain
LAAARHRREQTWIRHEAHATVGHVVQSLGVPLTEVGDLLIDGCPVPPRARPGAGATIAVGPPARPQHVPDWPGGFLLDVHLGALARRMRLLGLDTRWDRTTTDMTLLERANAERRLLLTRDLGLLRRRALWAGAHVQGQDPDRQLRDVLDRFDPPLAPWTRCPRCNGLLAPVEKSDVVHELLPGTRRTQHRFTRCTACARIYWPGAHHRRLRNIVAAATASSTTQ